MRRALFTALLAAAAVVGNVFHLSLFFGVDLLFGSVAALLALLWLGLGSGLLVAVAGGLYTLPLWGHPYALPIFVAEVAFIGLQREWARRRGRPPLPLAVASAFYWLLIGMPLALLTYSVGLDLDWSQILLIALKQSLNGIFNAALASLILLLVGLLRQPRSGRMSIADLQFSSLLAAMLLPGLLIAFWDNQHFSSELEARLGERLTLFARMAVRELDVSPRADLVIDPAHPALEVITRLFDASLLGYTDLQIHQTAATTLADGVLRLRLPADPAAHDSRLTSYRAARYELALPHADGALVVSVSAAPLIDRSQRAMLQVLAVLMGLTLIALLVAWIGSHHLSRLLRCLNTSARILPVAIRDRVHWIPPPASLFAETDQLASTLAVIARSLDRGFRALERERTNFSAFFNSVDDLVIVTTPTGRILNVNPSVERRLGYPVDVLVGMSLLDLHSPAQRQEVEAMLAARFAGDDGETSALPLLTRDGARIAVAARIWRGQWNHHDCLFYVSKDLTAELVARDELRAERDLFSAGPVFTIVWDAAEGWPVRQVSSNVADILGYPPAVLMDAAFRFAALIHPDDLGRVGKEVTGYLDGHSDVFEQSYRIKLHSGEYRWFYDFTKLKRDEQNRVVEIRGYLFDQTHLREAQQMLMRERQRLTNVIDGTRLGTWECNLETNETVFNEYWASICGYRLDELAPTSLEILRGLLHPDDLAVCERQVQAHLNGEIDHYLCEMRMRHRDGHWVWVLSEGRVVSRDAAGRPLLFAGTHADISLRKQAELELKRRELLDRLLVKLAGELLNLPLAGFDATIERSLGELGRHLDRAFLCLVDAGTDTLSKTHEWTAPGVPPLRARCQRVPLKSFPTILPRLRANESLVLTRLDGLAADQAAEYARLVSSEAVSLLLMPLIDAGQWLGCIGLESVRVPHRWSSNKREFLRIYANLLTSAVQRERSDAALRKSLERYDQLATQTRTIAWEIDAQGGYLFVSPVIEDVLGYRPEELVGKRFFDELAPASERAAFKQEVLDLFARHTIIKNFLSHVLHRDGRRIWLLSNGDPVLDADGALVCYRGNSQDITEHQEALAHLAASEQRLRTVFDHAPMGISIPDAERRFLYVNHAYAKLLGRERDELIGQPIDPLIHADDRAEIKQRFAELMAGQRDSYHLIRRYLRPNGEIAWGDLRVTLMPVAAGEPPLPVGIVEDITEKRAFQADNQRLQGELDSARERETIGHLASGIAHDFNNLLGVIDANLYYLGDSLRGESATPEVVEILEETQSALGHAKVITAGMLSLSRAGGMPIEPVALREVFSDLTAILRHLLPDSIETRIWVEDGVRAMSNGSFLQAALLNLVLNARDAMPDGGQLTLEAFQVAAAPVRLPRVGVLPLGAHVEIRVGDTGHGIPPEILERIFEPLFSTKARRRGHGLGLFMVQEFVTRAGAALLVDSRPGEGTEFSLLLPNDGASPSVAAVEQVLLAGGELPAPGSAALVGDSDAPRVLLVEDDPRVREAIGRLLRLCGLRCDSAEHGADALERLRHDPGFDLVLSDIAMPVLDGFGLTQALAHTHPELPVILMSGQDLVPDFPEGVDRALPILRKPLDIDRLKRAIDAALNGSANAAG
jgi:PAS domain S-box-containing protein